MIVAKYLFVISLTNGLILSSSVSESSQNSWNGLRAVLRDGFHGELAVTARTDAVNARVRSVLRRIVILNCFCTAFIYSSVILSLVIVSPFFLLCNRIFHTFAEAVLQTKFDPSFFIALADHLHYAIERSREEISLQNPLAWEVRNFTLGSMKLENKSFV